MEIPKVIKSPVLTEKSLQEATDGKYTFEVDLKANKREVAQAVKEAFNVDVLGVTTRILKGRRVRIRGTKLTRAASKFKKATVKVAAGQKIPAFETG
ncbi:MAG: 50S ribosomal protein L23 [Candidatus Woykebacteria bacterium GWB1_45_5]|uniref:Large ribosomal subunit protein uL23 n=2 Tax=Candidatus Woykeibacteriota TaxID=1817899 RepID=A0A1G1W2N5_9BACT|nr:MAG: 50S ribosomal protein L23 [Candidatus Woykebacteria bacterium GWA1_44_8]OGY23331.1 MAG: 50S ribosomal protein L23 [Candidatus Woykebacteria bacterium GWB1_45_5]